jgi:hypothetical protein
MDFSTATICDVIDVTLYKFNYYDNLIWTKCLNQIDYAVVNEDSILITPHQLRVLFDLNFERDLRKIEATTAELIHKDANSLYFLDKIITEFSRLKWIKLSLAKSRKFSRVVETNGNRTIRYSFKVLKTTLRLNEIFNPKDIQILNPILKQLDLIKDTQYNRVSAHMILNKLDSAINGLLDLNEHEVELLATLIDIFEFKVEQDNPEVLLVTDW